MPISRAIPSRLPILATLLGLALAGCDGVPALEVSTPNAGGQEAVAANDSTALPLPDPVLGPVDRRKAALATFLEERQVGEVPTHRDASVDLDGDGAEELLMLLDDPNWCSGGGCTLLVFHNQREDGYRLVTQASLAHPPIALGPQRHSGWRDLLVGVGGDGTQAGTVALQYNGEGYPANPTLLALLAEGATSRAQPLID